jgi:hypothetical protein
MGWTYIHRDKDMSVEDFIRYGLLGNPNELLDCAVDGFDAAYCACRAKDGTVIGVVVALEYIENEFYNFGYKLMEESVGPDYYECPAHVLKKLSPLPPKPEEGPDIWEYARSWREGCEANLAKKAEVRKRRAQLRDGCIIRFAEPLEFTSGKRYSELTVRKYKGKFILVTDSCMCVVPGWQKMSYEIIVR